MYQDSRLYGHSIATTDAEQGPLERRLMALDALSKLARQFSEKPDFKHLMNLLLMTLSGQFSVGDAMAVLKRPRTGACGQTFFATGRFRKCGKLAEMDVSRDNCAPLMGGQRVCRVMDFDLSDRHSGLIPELTECGVNLVCPLVHKEDLLGLIGLGERVNGKAFSQEDAELLVTVIDTITPFLANTYLFWEINRLNTWYLEVLDSVRQGVFVFDANTRLKKINAPAVEILDTFIPGTQAGDALRGITIDEVFRPEVFGNLVTEGMTSKIDKGRGAAGSVVARYGEMERVYNVKFSETSEGDEAGNDLIVTLDDVTAQRESEERLFNLQQLADRGVMASSISHELRNFLGLILGGLDLTQVAVMQGDGDKANENLDRLKANVESLEKYAAGLMDYTKLSTDRRAANLNTVISDVLSFISGQQRFKGITLRPELERGLPDLMMDSDQIAQLLLNLLNNAADAIAEARRSEGEIRVETRSDDEHVLLVLWDNGMGMKPEVRDSLFQSRLTTKEHGHGYGLVTCASIIEGHGATVAIDSELGEGTAFTIAFPRG